MWNLLLRMEGPYNIGRPNSIQLHVWLEWRWII
ncbi:hypothetical protein RSOL_323850 [Rhizoctonia solani AG-3 Rhs1AP]|uniref:Uncharacterized protein n=1 Tax=Rhizoctonia solani AG-3 Rhs1AP TaxID=1086054 RepID=A0A0A1UL87_9AGAM|nr:hypothetical protein RSOL_323850 [Rhizoctonia solani AG-3 Rhs1AP]